jgi:hypothetical protein
MTDNDDFGGNDDRTAAQEPIGADEPTRVGEPTAAGDRVGSVGKTRIDQPTPTDGAEPPVWKRPPVIVGAVVALLLVVAAVVLLSGGDDDDGDTAAGEGKGSTVSSTTVPETAATPSTGGAPVTDAPVTEPPVTEAPATAGTPTTAVNESNVCEAYIVMEDAVALVYDSGDLDDDEVVSRSHDLADSLETSAGLLESLADQPYGPQATMYAGFLDSMVGEFRDATTRAQVEAAGEKLFEPPQDVSEADTRMQDEYDAQCG